MAFVHLHVHTQYSLLDGAMSPNELVQSVAALEQPAVAITDSCNLYGAVQFFKACKGAGVHPVLGAKVAVEHRGMNYRDPRDPWTGFTLGLLVENEVGYKNLCKLINKMSAGAQKVLARDLTWYSVSPAQCARPTYPSAHF